MESSRLGRLEKVDLREIWESESADFTPWLCREENLTVLGDAIGMELELEAQEKNVGPFRADILCKDTSNGNWVLIENQLQRTDHSHLGQLLTYAAGLQAVTIVWISERFTDEHRAALDWLNEITDHRFNFFGAEIELWKIGTSPVAPKFNVLCKPNEWTQTVGDAARGIASGNLSDTRQLYLAYWQAFRDYLETQKSALRISTPLAQMWMNYSIGRSIFGLTTIASRQKQFIAAQFVIYGSEHVEYFRLLEQRSAKINIELGESVEWQELPDKNESRIRKTFANTDPSNRDDWPRQHQLLREWLERFHRCFAPMVRSLALDPPDADSNGSHH